LNENYKKTLPLPGWSIDNFARELEKPHPDNRHFRDNPVNKGAGQESTTTPSPARRWFAVARRPSLLRFAATRARHLASTVIRGFSSTSRCRMALIGAALPIA
jgi:hypothetical protein